ncbi:hypothetical protein C1631_021400 [Chryseobacterium phosphatilyticum]|uniref:RHS repeat-associated core domain-containing protein n=1 Tax=Chryseobacterium phosphatilyticum TaxID=475075 RepID=A0A316WQ16_9FLAO|nr:RHS repeat-associated core domain-containing protein [Chryseobacterium phosphatilyticum]PWN63541.1 hypothetical protein C1631_021400 [Chryseobacterium phosphatilyticum]
MWSPLKYQNPAYTNIAPGKSNGNISEIDWKSASDGVLKRYSYTYDALNRLKDAVYTEPNTTNPYNNYYNEYATYDLNGNIKTLKRNAFPVTGTTATQVDDLVYQYTGNRLDKVIENALNDTGYEGGNNTIDYDLNGNMINMKDKGIQTIGYNVLDLQNQLSISVTNAAGKVSTTNINHIYGAGGVKLRKTSVQQAYMGLLRIQTTDYLDGFQYTNIDDGQGCLTCKTESAYEEQAYRKVIGPVIPGGPKWTLDFVPTAEGFYSFTENRYIYQYKDHLGNVRVSFARNSAGAPEITGANNYYPFGLNHIGGGKSLFSNYHSYKFGGKELQETGMYDFGARMYMPDLGRWGVIDPMAEAMRRYSPYNYAFNNPISFIDPDGMQPRQFAMPSDARPDAPSTWINPSWVGRGGPAFGSIDTGFSGGGGSAYEGGASSYGFGSLYSPSNNNSYLLNELLAGWKARGLDINIEENGNLTFWTGNPEFIKGYSTNNDVYGEYHLGVLNSITVKNGDIPLDAYKNWADWSATTMEKGLESVVKQRTSLYNSGYWIDNLGVRRSTAYAGRSVGSLIGLRSDYVRTTAKLGKYAKGAGWVGKAINAGQIGYGVYQDGWKFGVKAQVATANVAGGMAGAAAGAWALGKIGGGIGTFVGPEGTAVGAVIGGIVGGIVGGFWGGEIAEGWADGILNKPEYK